MTSSLLATAVPTVKEWAKFVFGPVVNYRLRYREDVRLKEVSGLVIERVRTLDVFPCALTLPGARAQVAAPNYMSVRADGGTSTS
jgi:hypothetical protein